MVDIYNNKIAFLRLKPKKLFLLSIFLGVFLIIILFIMQSCKAYKHYLTRGYVVCSKECFIVSFVPSNIQFERITMNGKEIDYTIQDKILQIKEDEMLSYYKITFSCNEELLDKEIVELNFFYDKQSILNKFE